jgi:hypothetical protein
MGFWRLYRLVNASSGSVVSEAEEILSLAGVLLTSTLLTLLITAARRSPHHARCSHSNIFEPDVYETTAKLIFSFDKMIKNQQKSSKIISKTFSEIFSIF